MEQYLRRYAVPETSELAELPGALQWARVVVIPACNETAGFLRPPPPCHGRILLILVINETSGATPEVSAANRTLAGEVDKRHERIWQSASGLTLYSDPEEKLDVLLVDRFRASLMRGGNATARGRERRAGDIVQAALEIGTGSTELHPVLVHDRIAFVGGNLNGLE